MERSAQNQKQNPQSRQSLQDAKAKQNPQNKPSSQSKKSNPVSQNKDVPGSY